MFSKLWVSTYDSSEHYIFSTTLYLVSMLSQSFSLIIDHGISAPEHGIELVDGLNANKKVFYIPII